MDALKKAISKAGNQRKLAAICGVSQASVSKWLNNLNCVGEDKAILIERAFGPEVTCEDLRPDVNWSVLRRAKQRTNKKA